MFTIVAHTSHKIHYLLYLHHRYTPPPTGLSLPPSPVFLFAVPRVVAPAVLVLRLAVTLCCVHLWTNEK